MARYMVATHRAPVERDWLCKHCNASGTVTVDAVGTAEKRVWFSKASASSAANEQAQYALHDDAEQIASIVRCPTCRTRGRSVLRAIGSIVRDLVVAAFVGFVAGLIMFAITKSSGFGIAVGAVGCVVALGFGQEPRRRRAASAARVRLAPRPPSRPAVEPVRTPQPMEADPFRSPPAPPPIAILKPEVATVAPRAHSESGEQPAFLR